MAGHSQFLPFRDSTRSLESQHFSTQRGPEKAVICLRVTQQFNGKVGA